jgi:hypothetical protein
MQALEACDRGTILLNKIRELEING